LIRIIGKSVGIKERDDLGAQPTQPKKKKTQQAILLLRRRNLTIDISVS